MVGIVGILLLGSLAWSAVGALVSAVGAAGSAIASSNPRPPATLAPVAAVTPVATASPLAGVGTPTAEPPGATRSAATATPQVLGTATAVATPTAEAAAAPTAATAGRNPWILLPLPEPGARVPAGSVAVEARGRGDAPIAAMRLELDGSPLNVALEQRSDTTWRGSANAKLSSGEHTVRATVTDADGRNGSFRWTFTVGSGP
jgi:hypothetical protein